MRRGAPRRERGAALLAVLLLVAVTGAIAVTAMERLSLSRTIASNAAMIAQARAHARGVEQLSLLVIDDLIARDPERTTLEGGWLGATRSMPMPGGAVAEARLLDGGNCFNLNSVVEGDPRSRLVRRNSGVQQFAGLMIALRVPEVDARRIAEAAADWADSDIEQGPAGAEDSAYANAEPPYRTANTLFADPAEARLLAGMTADLYDRLRPWLCVHPAAELSPLNVNTLTAEQAPLLAMLAPGQIDIGRAERVLAARPRGGWANIIDFWRTERLSELAVPLDTQLQPQVRTRWFRLDVRVTQGDIDYGESVLIDARLRPSRLASRRRED
ncbi:MAG: type II secretion system minor pseudopilin GspK [Sphingomonas sp.]